MTWLGFRSEGEYTRFRLRRQPELAARGGVC